LKARFYALRDASGCAIESKAVAGTQAVAASTAARGFANRRIRALFATTTKTAALCARAINVAKCGSEDLF
jgi:hypothetical protein